MAEGDCCDQPKLKKQKLEEPKKVHAIFKEFLLKTDKMDMLQGALTAVDNGLMDMILAHLHVESSNAIANVSFKHATIETSVIDVRQSGTVKGLPVGVPVGDIFLVGIDVLKRYLNTDGTELPNDDLKREALQILLEFLSSEADHKVLYEEKDTKPEVKWSVTLAQHLLSKLAVKSTYTMDSGPGFTMLDEAVCECSAKDKLVGKIGDTSFGSSKGWHGATDIIMEDDLLVSVFDFPKDSDESEDESEERSVSSVEVKRSENFDEKDNWQIISQTIVFSFLQRKINKAKLKNFLIPGIGINAKSILVCFFDTEHDVLLRSLPVNIFSSKDINYIAVVFLWLTLNYRLFCSGLSKVMKGNKADFIKALGDNAKIYFDDVAIPMHKSYTTQTKLFQLCKLPRLEKSRDPVNEKYFRLL